MAGLKRPVSSKQSLAKSFPESSCREDEALEVLAYYHANGNRDNPLVQFEFQEIRAAINDEKAQARSNWFDLFRTPANRRRMRIVLAIAVFSQWSGSGLMYVLLLTVTG